MTPESTLNNAYNTIPCGIVIFKAGTSAEIVYANDYYYSVFANGNEKKLNISEDDRGMLLSLDARLKDAEQVDLFYRCTTTKRDVCRAKMSAARYGEDTYIGVVQDMTERYEMLVKMRHEKEKFAIALCGTGDVVFENNLVDKTSVLYAPVKNSNEVEIIRISDDSSYMDGSIVHPDDRESFWVKQKNDAEKVITARMKLPHDNEWYWYRVHRQFEYDLDGNPVRAYGTIRNIDDEMRHESELQNKIEMDPVLKIYNRNAAVDRINKYLAANPDRRDYALLVMDIDDFKDINDTYGHLYGDAVIAMAAKELKDVTGNDGIVGRYGGDEFFVFIRGVSGSIIAEKAEQCVQHIKSIQVTDGKYITCSIGVALGMSFKETPNYKALFEKADKALYAVKNNGKADWKVYNEGKMADTDGHAIDYESEDDVDSAELVSSRDMMKVFLELSASAKTSDAAIYKIIRYVAEKFGVDWMQIMQVNSKEDLITIKYEWCNDPKFRNNAGRSGYYAHSDIIRFRDYFEKHPVFIVRPENTVGFSMKFQREFEKNMRYEVLYNANVTSDENFYMFVCTRFDKSKRWDETEALELNAATKMMTMYAAQAGKETENERKYKELVDYDKKTGLYTLQKFYEQMGRLRKIAAERGDSVAIIHTDIGNFLKFNRKFGTDEGDNVLKDFADIVVGNDNPDYNISAHVDGTDIFISARRVENGNLDFVNDIDRENKKFCAEQNKKYQGAELVFRTGVYVMNKEDLGGDAVDCAITAKRMAKNREESYCAVYANEQ